MSIAYFCRQCHEPLEDATTYCGAHPDAAVVRIEVPHPHTCPDCTELWQCADADCEPEEQEKCCDRCFRAYLGELEDLAARARLKRP